MISLSGIRAVARKETRDFFRDPAIRKGIVVQVVLLFVVFGFAMKSDLKNGSWAVFDGDDSALSRRLVDDIRATRLVKAPLSVDSYDGVDRAFRRSEAAVALVIPAGFERALQRGEPGTAQVLLSGAEPLVASRMASLIQDLEGRFLREQAAARGDVDPHQASVGTLAMRTQYVHNPSLDDRWFFGPTIPVIIMTQLLVGLACLSFVSERERGTWEHMLAQPLRPLEVVIGKAIPFFAVTVMVLAAAVPVVVAGAGVSPRGSIAAMIAGSVLHFAASFALGAALATVARNVQQSIYLAVFLITPSMSISGFMSSQATMPAAIQRLADLLPATHYVKLMRATFVRGASFEEVLPSLGMLAAIAAVLLGVTLLRFPRTLGKKTKKRTP